MNTVAPPGPANRSGSALVAHPLPDDLVELIAERFGMLSDPTRIKLLDRLREGEASVLELTNLVGTSQQNISKHLNLLQHAGIVTRRKQGNFVYYRVADETVYTICEAVCGSLQNRFNTLQQLTDPTAPRPLKRLECRQHGSRSRLHPGSGFA
jgi:DNA-binding transcriptional ArsR family regulator